MSDGLTGICRRTLFGAKCALALLLMGFAFSTGAQTITNLEQLTQLVSAEQHVYGDVDFQVTVLAVSRPKIGAVIVQDESGAALLELGDCGQRLVRGERIHLWGWRCLLRRREMGIQISAGPVIDNDGVHVHRTWGGWATLTQGLNPIQLEWFNSLGPFELAVSCAISNTPIHAISSSNLWHAVVDEAGHTNFLPGLRAECYEGYWEMMPDFNLLRPVKVGVVTNFDLGFRTRDERVGIRFTGYFKAPRDGHYLFHVRSDDGSLLFFGRRELAMARVGFTNVPAAATGFAGEAMKNLTERPWIMVGGRVSFASEDGEGLNLELHSGHEAISVGVVDAAGLEPARLLNAEIEVAGVGQGVRTAGRRVVLGRLFAASGKEIVVVSKAANSKLSLPITSVEQVRRLSVAAARRALPVRIRGVVTGAKNNIYDRYMTIQDDTGGIFVNIDSVTNAAPAFGEFWEVEGHTAPGNFAPIIMADKMTFLGQGQLPVPIRPKWMELLNGSMDSQWAELKGLVTGVHSNQVTLLLPEGQLNVLMDDHYESDLKPYLNSVVKIRGVLYADWNSQTREVRVGSVMMRNTRVCVETPAPAHPFDAVLKTPRELRLFDPTATTFRRVQVRGEIIYTDATQAFLEEDGAGLRLLPAGKFNVHAGDLVEAVGYPEINRRTLLMRQVIMRTLRRVGLPVPKKLVHGELSSNNLDSTYVRAEGKLLGWHSESDGLVLEVQSGIHLYNARLAPRWAGQFHLRAGSRIALNGVYVSLERNQLSGGSSHAFELLLNSPAAIQVLSQPSWWTLRRLLFLVGALIVVLAFTAIWITQLRRLVEQRTLQLQVEIHERERVEGQHALEAERSRIARDLHDDLGSSLTEISVLANTGQRRDSGEDRVGLFQAIANKARRLIAALDVIVWAVDPEDNSLQSLGDYLNGYAQEFFAHTNIVCRFKVPVSFPQIMIGGRVRHDLVMMVKEALNNVVRHADATEVQFRMAVSGGNLQIEISDNGKGLGAREQDGHGLKNLASRLQLVGGRCHVESRGDSGTCVTIALPLAQEIETAKASGAHTTH